MPVIPVNNVVNLKRLIGKMEGRGGGEAQGVADPKRGPRGRVFIHMPNLNFYNIQNLKPASGTFKLK
jgi:hypothetical protein